MHPEGFEPPAYWFVANCSIQLSYGCTRYVLFPVPYLFQDTKTEPLVQPVSGASRLRSFVNDRGRCSCRIHQLQTGASQQLPHNWLGQPGGVVLDVDGACALIKVNTTNAVDLANVGKCKDGTFTRRHGVLVGHVNSGHSRRIPVAGASAS